MNVDLTSAGVRAALTAVGLEDDGESVRIEGRSVSELVERFGTPLVVVSPRRAGDNAAALTAALSPGFLHLVSYKASYVPAALRCVHEHGVGAEVASARELLLARRLGLADSRIVWSAVALDAKDAALAAASDLGWVGLNTLDDIRRIGEATRDRASPLNVMLRVHPEGVASDYLLPGSRLGLDVRTGVADEAARLVRELPGLRLRGLHSHLCVREVRPDGWAASLRALAAVATRIEQGTGERVRTLGIGGGLAGRTELKLAGGDLREFADALEEVRRELGREVEIAVEPGRWFFDDAAVALTRVVSRAVARGRRWAIVDVGTNLLVPFEGRRFGVSALGPPRGAAVPTSVGDRTSSYSGVIADDVPLAPVEVGDVLAIASVGAYTHSVAQQFMFGLPPTVVIERGGVRPAWPADDDKLWVKRLLAGDACQPDAG